MCYITATQLKNNLSYYMELSQKEKVYVTKNKKVITVLTNPQDDALNNFLNLQRLFNNKDKDIDTDKLLEEEILSR